MDGLNPGAGTPGFMLTSAPRTGGPGLYDDARLRRTGEPRAQKSETGGAGDSRYETAVARSADSILMYGLDPGAGAPGFMLSRAPRACAARCVGAPRAGLYSLRLRIVTGLCPVHRLNA